MNEEIIDKLNAVGEVNAVSPKEIKEADEDMDGEWRDDYVMYYVCPDGTLVYDEEDAIQVTIQWLNSEHIAGM